MTDIFVSFGAGVIVGLLIAAWMLRELWRELNR